MQTSTHTSPWSTASRHRLACMEACSQHLYLGHVLHHNTNWNVLPCSAFTMFNNLTDDFYAASDSNNITMISILTVAETRYSLHGNVYTITLSVSDKTHALTISGSIQQVIEDDSGTSLRLTHHANNCRLVTTFVT
jgi:hypothetical protein